MSESKTKSSNKFFGEISSFEAILDAYVHKMTRAKVDFFALKFLKLFSREKNHTWRVYVIFVRKFSKLFFCRDVPGLPDFSWHKVPKRGKIPNDHKITK
jgi:hypothetical protein